MKKRRMALLAMMCCAFGMVAMDAAATGPLYEQSTAAKMTRKLSRGALNVLFCWGDIPHYVSEDSQNTDWFTGTITGTAKGVASGCGRLLIGAYDVITFPIPIPEDYESFQRTEFVFMEDLD